MSYKNIPIEALSSRLEYNQETGVLSWKQNPQMLKRWNTRYSGKPISCIGSHGYICFNFTHAGKKYHLLAHRVCFAIHNGYWPDAEIDHVDRVRINNRPDNLRQATSAQNKQNRGAVKNNKSGLKGVVFLGKKQDGSDRYGAFIAKNGRTEYIGTYASKEEAHDCYNIRAKELFGEYAGK